MKRIITAIGNEELNKILKTQTNIIVEGQDIQYQEGILEALEEYREIDVIILHEDIIGELDLEDLIRGILLFKNEIEIILITNQELKVNHNVVKIINNNINYVKQVVEILNNNVYINEKTSTTYRQIKEEKEIIRKETQKEKIRIQKKNEFADKVVNIKERLKELIRKRKRIQDIICVIGSSGIGKTSFISILSKIIKSRKILIINFDFVNNNLHSVFGVNMIPKDIKEKIKDKEFLNEFRLKEKNIQKLIVKVEKRLDIISNVNLIFDNNYKISNEGIQEMLEELKKQYDLILIDTTQEMKYEEITECILNYSTKIICLVGGNLIEVKKTIDLIKDNQKDKIDIVYNKKNKYTIKKKILEILFFRFKIIGVLHYDIEYDKIINKNINRLYISKKIKKEFNKIIKKLQIN